MSREAKNYVIESREVLTADYLPNRMVHRGSERKQIANNLEHIVENENPIDMLVYGDPGTGKTAMSRYVVNELKDHDPQLKSAYVNCFQHSTKFDIFYSLLKDVGKKMIHRKGTATDELIQEFERVARNNQLVIVVDEVDQLTEDEVLYELSRFRETGLIMIANRNTVFHNLDDRVRSRMSGRDEIRFKQYSEKELTDILIDRRKYGLKNEAISKTKLRKIAAYSNGDARRAINTLRLAANKAENREKNQITMKEIEEAKPKAVEEQKKKSIEKLHAHQKTLLKIISNDSNITSREIYQEYEKQVENPKSKRTLRRYLNKMENYNLINSQGKGKGTEYNTSKNIEVQ